MSELVHGAGLLARADAAGAVALPRALGVELLDRRDPCAGVVFTVSGLALTPSATLHAGALAPVLELAAYLAVLPSLTVEEHAVTHHVSAQHLRAAREGQRVEVVATLDRRGRRVAFASVCATRTDGAGPPSGAPDAAGAGVIARAQITKSIVTV